MLMGTLTRVVDADRVAKHSARRGATRMRLHSRLTWFVAFGVLAYAASPAGAQQAQGQGAGGASGQVGFSQQVNTPLEAQVTRAEGYVTATSQIRETVKRMLQAARQQRDVVKTLCLTDKLNQIDVGK